MAYNYTHKASHSQKMPMVAICQAGLLQGDRSLHHNDSVQLGKANMYGVNMWVLQSIT